MTENGENGDVVPGVVSKSAREIPEAGEAGPAEVDVAERDRRGQRGLQPRGWQREGGGPFPEKSGDAARQLEHRHVRERGETDPQPEPGQREAHERRRGRGGKLAEYAGKQRWWGDVGLVQPKALLCRATSVSVGPVALENCEPLLIIYNNRHLPSEIM